MFEQLDDPQPFDATGRFRAAVETRAKGLRRQRRTRRVAMGCGAAATLSAGLVAVRGNGGENRADLVVTDTAPAVDEVTTTVSATTTTALPAELPAAQNYLVVGSDNRACMDPNSPYAGAFLGDGADAGSRSDTIMLIRVDPSSGQSAVLSFPRDLWVTIAGSTKKGRINAASDPQNPQKLIDTIGLNFLVPVDHYVGVDFCAFKDVVDAIGGVAVPFQFAVRDRNTGLNIEQPECHTFQGDEALAYVRSRHLDYLDPATNEWVADPTSDLGRIARQQDFLVRAIATTLDRIRRNPLVANDVIGAAIRNVTTDSELTVNSMVELAVAMSNTDPASIGRFQVEGHGVRKGNADVLEPVTDSAVMQQVLAIFRGDATPADAPTAEPAPIEDQAFGIVPPDDPTCR